MEKEKQPIVSTDMLKTIRRQNKINERDYPKQLIHDEWNVNNSSIASYETFFSSVTKEHDGIGIVDFVNNRPLPVVVDLMSPPDALETLFSDIKDKPKLGLAVSLQDKRGPIQKKRDNELTIKQLSGDVLRSSTWLKIQKELEGKQADLIMERAMGGLGFLPLTKNVCGALMKRTWNLLSDHDGMLLLQTSFAFDPDVSSITDYLNSTHMVVGNWLKQLAEEKITAVYDPDVWTRYGYFGALKLIKSPDSPKDLPLPAVNSIQPAISREEKANIKAILKWSKKNS